MSNSAAIPGLLVLVSGISGELFQELERLRAKVIHEGERLAYTSIDTNAVMNSGALVAGVVRVCSKKFEKLDHDRYARLWVVNLVLVPAGCKWAVKCELDFCFNVVTNKYHHDQLTKTSRSQASNISDHCGKLISKARSALSKIRGEVQDRDSRSPLLLPKKNFNCSNLSNFTNSFESTLLDSGEFRNEGRRDQDPFDVLLNRMRSSIKRETHKGKTVFVDDTGGRFESPCKAGPRHGGKRGEDPACPPICRLRANLRHGVPYHNQFHYDFTTDEQKRKITRQVSSCHEDKHNSPNTRRLNIFPNDFYEVPASERRQ